MDLSNVLTFDFLALCVITAAVAREIWIRSTPARNKGERDAIADATALDRQFDIQFAPPPADGGPVVAVKRLILAQLGIPENTRSAA